MELFVFYFKFLEFLEYCQLNLLKLTFQFLFKFYHFQLILQFYSELSEFLIEMNQIMMFLIYLFHFCLRNYQSFAIGYFIFYFYLGAA